MQYSVRIMVLAPGFSLGLKGNKNKTCRHGPRAESADANSQKLVESFLYPNLVTAVQRHGAFKIDNPPRAPPAQGARISRFHPSTPSRFIVSMFFS
ncbi:hypothetical protein WJ970_19695 [Achromobacter xylosoxidans]